jgi:hypothetical protein
MSDLKNQQKSAKDVYVCQIKRGKTHPTNVKCDKSINVTSGSQNKLDGVKASTALSPMHLEVLVCEKTGRAEEEFQDKKAWDACKKVAIRHESLWQTRKLWPQLDHWDSTKKCPTAKFYSDMLKGQKERHHKNEHKALRRPLLIKNWIARLKREHKARVDDAHASRDISKFYDPEAESDDEETELDEISDVEMEQEKDKEPESDSEESSQDLEGFIHPKPIGFWWKGRLIESWEEARIEIYATVYLRCIRQQKFFALACELATKKVLMIKDCDGPDVNKYPHGRKMTQELVFECIADSWPMGHGFVAAAAIAGLKWPTYTEFKAWQSKKAQHESGAGEKESMVVQMDIDSEEEQQEVTHSFLENDCELTVQFLAIDQQQQQ